MIAPSLLHVRINASGDLTAVQDILDFSSRCYAFCAEIPKVILFTFNTKMDSIEIIRAILSLIKNERN